MPRQQRLTPPSCGCADPHYARGLCKSHYDRMRRPRKGPRPKNLAGCSEPGCPRDYHARGLCQRHYQRQHYRGRGGKPSPPRPHWRNPLVPKIEELAQTMSQSQIAKLLKISRNVVIGVVDRARQMGRLPGKPRRLRTPHNLLPSREFAVCEFPSPGSCLWMDGDPRDPSSHFCGARVFIFGEAWCAEHRRRVYRPMLVVSNSVPERTHVPEVAEAAD